MKHFHERGHHDPSETDDNRSGDNVNSAIFQRAGGATVRNQASKPCSSRYVRSPSVNSATCFCHLPNRSERSNASLSCSLVKVRRMPYSRELAPGGGEMRCTP